MCLGANVIRHLTLSVCTTANPLLSLSLRRLLLPHTTEVQCFALGCCAAPYMHAASLCFPALASCACQSSLHIVPSSEASPSLLAYRALCCHMPHPSSPHSAAAAPPLPHPAAAAAPPAALPAAAATSRPPLLLPVPAGLTAVQGCTSAAATDTTDAAPGCREKTTRTSR